jgi:hypothetical protein
MKNVWIPPLRSFLGRVFLLTAVIILQPSVSSAQYIDPGTGSYVFQLLIAGVTFLVFIYLRFRTQLIAVFRKFLRKGPTEDDH